jgi:hypothetical protein
MSFTEIKAAVEHLTADQRDELRLWLDGRNAIYTDKQTPTEILGFAGAWSDMPEAEFAEMISDIKMRRKNAFNMRIKSKC